jgi:hypothetical protein
MDYHARSMSPLDDVPPQTFIFSELSVHDKAKFMEFLLTNHVEFQLDPNDQTYTATIKIVNNQEAHDYKRPPEQEVINGFDQMRQLQTYESQTNDIPHYHNS